MSGVRSNAHVINEVRHVYASLWAFCLQEVRLMFTDGEIQVAPRFCWRRPPTPGQTLGSMQARGQALLPSWKVVLALKAEADREGWGQKYDDDEELGKLEVGG